MIKNKRIVIGIIFLIVITTIAVLFFVHTNSVTTGTISAPHKEGISSTSTATTDASDSTSTIPSSVFTHGNFIADFPGKPTLKTQSHTDNGFTYTEYNYTYTDPSGFGGYTVDSVQFPYAITPSEGLLRTVASAHVNDVNLNYVPKVTGKVGLIDGSISTSTFMSSADRQSLSYHIDAPQTDVHDQGRDTITTKDWKMYQVSVIYHGSKPADVDRFINSFQFK